MSQALQPPAIACTVYQQERQEGWEKVAQGGKAKLGMEGMRTWEGIGGMDLSVMDWPDLTHLSTAS